MARCYYYDRPCLSDCYRYCDGALDNIAGASPCRREGRGMLIFTLVGLGLLALGYYFDL